MRSRRRPVRVAADLHREVEGIHVDRPVDVLRMDVARTDRQRPDRLVRVGDRTRRPFAIERQAAAGTLDELGRGQVVQAGPRSPARPAGDHVRRRAQAGGPDRGGRRRGRDQPGAPQAGGAPRGDHALRPGRGPLDDDPPADVGGGQLGRRVREVEAGRPATVLLAHRQDAWVRGLEGKGFVDTGHEIDVAGAGGECIRGGRERAQHVDDHDRAVDVMRGFRADEPGAIVVGHRPDASARACPPPRPSPRARCAGIGAGSRAAASGARPRWPGRRRDR